jgi:predicted transcriptional regulator
MVAVIGWTQEMIGNLLNLTQPAITQRFQSEIADLQTLIESKLKLRNPADLISDRFKGEIPDLEKLLESKLKVKNPADLSGDSETPTPEILGWALKLKGEEDGE